MLAIINAEMRRRHDFGLSTELIDISVVPLVDDKVGMFMRCTLHFDDGGEYTFDTVEMNPVLKGLRATMGH